MLRALGLELGEDSGDRADDVPPSVDDTERALLVALSGEERYADELIDDVDAQGGADAVLSALTALELRGLVAMSGDGRYGRT